MLRIKFLRFPRTYKQLLGNPKIGLLKRYAFVSAMLPSNHIYQKLRINCQDRSDCTSFFSDICRQPESSRSLPVTNVRQLCDGLT